MNSLNGIDPVFGAIKNDASHYGFRAENPVGQQILLVGDLFFGYRFTSPEYTAVWSVHDQTLTFFDIHGKKLGVSNLYAVTEIVHDNDTMVSFRESKPLKKAA